MTVRADFYDHLLRHPTLPAAIESRQVNLGPMTRAQLQGCIEGPAVAVGLRFEGNLAERILDDVGEDEGKLPLLEYALRETWQASRKAWQSGGTPGVLTFAAYHTIGRVGGAIGARAEQIYERLDEPQRHAARRLFVSLVTPGEGQEDTRARAPLPDEPAMAEVVREFSDPAARLLVTGWDATRGKRLAEVSHEALIRNWDRLRSWIADNRETLRTRDRIRAQMKRWEQENEPNDLLLQRGRALEEGRQLLTSHGDVLIDDVRPYIEKSDAYSRQRKVREIWLLVAICSLMGIFMLVPSGYQYRVTVPIMERQTAETIRAEIAGLAEQYRAEGLEVLRQVILRRSAEQPHRASIYLLVDSTGRLVAGNLDSWPQAVPDPDGWLTFAIEVSPDGETVERRRARAASFLLSDGFRLLVGREVEDTLQLRGADPAHAPLGCGAHLAAFRSAHVCSSSQSRGKVEHQSLWNGFAHERPKCEGQADHHHHHRRRAGPRELVAPGAREVRRRRGLRHLRTLRASDFQPDCSVSSWDIRESLQRVKPGPNWLCPT